MGGIAKAVGGLFGGKKGGSAPSIVQPAASAAPAAQAAAGATEAIPGIPTPPAPGATGTMGTEAARKPGATRRRGRLETLLTEMGGSIERFGD